MTHATLGRLSVSRETLDRLKLYEALLRKWNPRINLVSRASLESLWERHFVDSAQLIHIANPGRRWVDLGSGGGFPGLVAAIVARETFPECGFVLVESDQRKAAFLSTVVRETEVECRVLARRIEEVDPQNASTLSARALADLPTLLGFADRHLAPDGVALFPKGKTWKNEVVTARGQWSFSVNSITSWTQAEAAVLQIKGVSRERSNASDWT